MKLGKSVNYYRVEWYGRKKAKGFIFSGLLPVVHSIGLARTNRQTKVCYSS